jgi:hypothetical protein
MFPAGREWFRFPGASREALDTLRAAAGVELPAEYFDLLAFSNGGEGPMDVMPLNFCLDPAEDALKYKAARTREEYFPNFFIFGSSGGGDYVAFDLRRGAPPWPVVAIDMTNINLDESVQRIAPDFGSFLEHVGLEASIADQLGRVKLRDAIALAGALSQTAISQTAILFAERIAGKFTPDSWARVVEMSDDDLRRPLKEVAAERAPGMEYFLEVEEAKYIVEGYTQNYRGGSPSPGEIVARVIEYAEKDA